LRRLLFFLKEADDFGGAEDAREESAAEEFAREDTAVPDGTLFPLLLVFSVTAVTGDGVSSGTVSAKAPKSVENERHMVIRKKTHSSLVREFMKNPPSILSR
jgi:hypothetical protein